MRRNNNSPKCTRYLIEILLKLSDGNLVPTDMISLISVPKVAYIVTHYVDNVVLELIVVFYYVGLKEKVIQNRRKYLGINKEKRKNYNMVQTSERVSGNYAMEILRFKRKVREMVIWE